ncbi:ABC transporter permease [Nocardioides sp. NPDC004968]|uniref:ABC transporter permease n=1 Tax=Nocardioides sp. NPDC004968 TaxID=3155894 RepID=UPI0033A03744
MAEILTEPATALAEPPPTRQSLVRTLTRDRLALVGLILVVGLIVIAILAPWLAPYPDQGRGAANVVDANLAPSLTHPFGTDDLGRDMLSRILMGARPALLISVSVVAAAAAIGVPLGAIAGYRGGWLDSVLMRVTEIFQSFPPLLLAMVVVALLGPDLKNAALALVVSWWPWYARLVRAEAKSLRERPFVAAAEAIGVPTWTILRRHIMKNSLTPVLVQATVDVGTVVLAAGSLAFIGLGAQPPAPDWGLMVAEGRSQIFTSWWVSTFAGLAIFVTVLAFNLLGDSLRDILDPRRHSR